MNLNEIKQALKLALIVIGVYIGLSLITGAMLSLQGFPAPFTISFVLNAASGASLYWLVKNS